MSNPDDQRAGSTLLTVSAISDVTQFRIEADEVVGGRDGLNTNETELKNAEPPSNLYVRRMAYWDVDSSIECEINNNSGQYTE
ncbi:hypothetical protein LSH36_685g02040 [Paralvinella palmiformis]|uniref:Uncharacterized protein n=1 Tax=Paralvinella palmiformis TaxID=53620 RepID=A0AAD9J309_9ANNE|nr:hypothetical protein LSH36_685g02040 [Paralvinella palmiformis]